MLIIYDDIVLRTIELSQGGLRVVHSAYSVELRYRKNYHSAV